MYTETSVKNIIEEKNLTLDNFCSKFKNVKVKGEIKALNTQGDYGLYWCKFSLFDKNNKLECINKSRFLKKDIQNNKVYELSGSVKNSKFGIQFEVYKMTIVEDELSEYDKLYSTCMKRNYFNNKKSIKLHEINSIVMLSKEGTQGYNDFVNQLNFNINIEVVPVRLEGEETAGDISKQINKINYRENRPNVIIILRGGGSTSDISKSFDKLELFESIRNSNIPVITAIGHTADSKEKLLITQISDLDFGTPTTAVNNINNEFKKYYTDIFNNFKYKYCSYISNKLEEINEYISSYYQKVIDKLKDKIMVEKKNLLNYEVFETSKKFVYVPENGRLVKYKLVKTDESIDMAEYNYIKSINNLDELRSDIKYDRIRALFVKIEKNIHKRDKELEIIQNSLYHEKIFDFNKDNMFKIKQILTFYLYQTENKDNHSINNNYEQLLELNNINIDETTDYDKYNNIYLSL